MASLIKMTSSLVFIVLLVLSELANANADGFDDLPLEDLEPEARLSFTSGNTSSVTFDPYVKEYKKTTIFIRILCCIYLTTENITKRFISNTSQMCTSEPIAQ